MTDSDTSATERGWKVPGRPLGLPRRDLLKAVGAAGVLGTSGVGAASETIDDGDSLDCNAIGQAAGKQAKQKDGVCRVNFPRTDLNVTIQRSNNDDLEPVEIKPTLALTSWIAFKQMDDGGDGDGQALMLGDLVLTGSEKNQVTSRLQQGGVHQTAIHKHLPDLSQPVWWTHVKGTGDSVEMAKTINNGLAETETPMEAAGGGAEGVDLDTDKLDEIIGHSGTVDSGVYKYGIRLDESVTTEGVELTPAMGAAIALGFQPLGDGRAAINGDLAMTADEVNPVIQALRENDIRVVSLHNHMLEEKPRLFFMHFWQTGQATELAKGLRAGLDKSNSGRNGG